MKLLEILLFIFIILAGCQGTPKTESRYYETGELRQKITQDSADCHIYSEYYKNGNLRLEGKVCNEIKKGKWKEWYIDSKLKWEGYFNDSIRVINYDKQIPDISIHGSPDKIYPDTTYFIRINMPGVHPEDMIVTSNNGIIQLYNNRDEYDFVITPKNTGELELVVYVMKEQQMYQIGKKQLIVDER